MSGEVSEWGRGCGEEVIYITLHFYDILCSWRTLDLSSTPLRSCGERKESASYTKE